MSEEDLSRIGSEVREAYARNKRVMSFAEFNWIFPSQKLQKGGIGYGRGYDGQPGSGGDSFAYLDDEMIDAKLVDEMRDNPLLLLPQKKRQELDLPSDYIRFGDLGHKNKQI